jgi:adenylate cyclase
VLEGSVRKSGRHLRISAQLVQTDNGCQVWSESYDRNLDDDIATAVVAALKMSLLAEDAPKAAGT